MSELIDQVARDRAVDPTRSVIVQAPAGSGKTTLLVTRYLRLLASVGRPEEILALTFTRKAAGEMRERVLAVLADDDDPLGRGIMARSSNLGWNLDTQPSRLRILTIDGFAASLAAALPVAAGIGESKILPDATALYEEAVLGLFERIDQDDDIGPSLSAFLALHDNDYGRARRALVEMLRRREQWVEPVRQVMQLELDRPQGLQAQLRAAVDSLYAMQIDAATRSLRDEFVDELVELTQASASNLGMSLANNRSDPGLWCHAARTFLTQEGAPRQRFTVNQGFPPDAEARTRKTRARTLARSLSRADAEVLEEFLHAPHLDTPPEEVATLLPIAVTLGFAASELAECFARKRCIDFTELLLAAKRALGTAEQPSDLALALDHRIQHLLIDEFQDTSAAQLTFIETVIGGWLPADGHSLFAVGDPMQSIYLFRDADVSYFQHATRQGIADIPLEFLALTHNFRSHSELIDWSNAIFPGIFGSRDDPSSGAMRYQPATAPRAARSGGTIDSRWFGCSRDRREEANFIASHVERLRGIHSDESVAVLVRNRSHAGHLIDEFERRGIAWSGTEMSPLADEPAVRDLLALYRSAWDPADRLAWFALLRGPLVGLCRADLARVGEHGTDFAQALVSAACGTLSADGRDRIARLREVWLACQPSRDRLPPAQWLESLWLRLGGPDAYTDPGAREHVVRVLALIETLQPNLAEPLRVESALARLYARPVAVENAIVLMTIHGAKGLEFDHVVVPALDKPPPADDGSLVMWQPTHAGLLVGSKTSGGPGSVYAWLRRQRAMRTANERARLLYVAVTRARRSLLLTGECDPEAGPPRRSLLELVWDPTAAVPASTEPTVAETISTRVESRLRADYAFRPPKQIEPMRFESLRVASQLRTVDAHDVRVAIGTVVHRELAHLARTGVPAEPQRYLENRRARFSSALAGLGVADAAAVDVVIAHLHRTLEDVTGRWVLTCEGETEVSIRALIDGHLGSHVIDRMLVDEHGHTWVIDYKTGTPGSYETASDFIASQLRDHAAQVRRYARLLHAMHGVTPRAALYLTGVARLVEVGSVP